ncbi:FAD/NAD(P)-binding protein [Corynebacterium sp. AOP40-9SA-29]|uniref:FAD/NAD(P)-binding protein n=1 Tax=Corynebacterium sp. AOP40-9SA-29 TaxID=3457677 RepID=UPI00403388C6
MSTLVFVGAGPRATGVLLALAALEQGTVPADLTVHLVDPYPAGAGRIWRADQPREVWMNNTSDEITVYAGDGIDGVAGVAGPTLAEWYGGRAFVPRNVASGYLRDALSRAVTELLVRHGVQVVEHLNRADSVRHDGGRRQVHLDDGTVLEADILLLAQGHLDVGGAPEAPGHTPPGYTVDQDFSHLGAGQDVLVRGMGLAFIDLMEILTEGRGGRFTDGEYVASGKEPVLWIGSRRGVPYRSKPVEGPPLVTLRHLVPGAVPTPGGLQDVLFRELRDQWASVTDEPLDLRRIDRPLDGLTFADHAAVEQEVTRVVESNLRRATDGKHPQDAVLYGAVVASYFRLRAWHTAGVLDGLDGTDREVVERLAASFSYLCSGPPPQRLGNLLALHRAGIVRFLGPDTRFEADDDGGFTASGAAGETTVHADHLVDARLSPVTVGTVENVKDPLLRSLLNSGELGRTVGIDGEPDGSVRVDASNRAVGADGQVRDDLFVIGMVASDGVKEAFGRPSQQTRVFAANQTVAKAVAVALAGTQGKVSGARPLSYAGGV